MKERDSLHIKLAHQVGGAIACLLTLALLLGLTACGGGQARQPQDDPAAVPVNQLESQKPESKPEPDAAPDLPDPADPASQEDGEEHDGFPEPAEDDEFPAVEYSFTQEEFDQLVADTLSGLTGEDMTAMEQARAIFDYVHNNIRYTGSSDKSDWVNGAYVGLTTGRGDCFTYYAVSRALLTAAEIDNLEVQRVEDAKSRHYWNLVNCGDGWYHFDACPRSIKMPSFLSFMVTDQQVADFTAMAGRNYYDFDGSLLPERATEIVTNTRPIPRPPVEEDEPETEDPNAAGLEEEPVLPPEEAEGDPGAATEPPADLTGPAPDPDAAGVPDGAELPPDPAGEPPVDVWTEPPAEEWPEPVLDGGGDAGGYGETEAG